MAKLKGKHSSQPFNPEIANVFSGPGKLKHGAEALNASGAAREAGFPEPVIEYETSGLWVNFPFSEEIVSRTRARPGMQLGEKPREKTREKILAAGRGEPTYRPDELARSLGSRQGRGVAYHPPEEGRSAQTSRRRQGGHWVGFGPDAIRRTHKLGLHLRNSLGASPSLATE